MRYLGAIYSQTSIPVLKERVLCSMISRSVKVSFFRIAARNSVIGAEKNMPELCQSPAAPHKIWSRIQADVYPVGDWRLVDLGAVANWRSYANLILGQSTDSAFFWECILPIYICTFQLSPCSCCSAYNCSWQVWKIRYSLNVNNE